MVHGSNFQGASTVPHLLKMKSGEIIYNVDQPVGMHAFCPNLPGDVRLVSLLMQYAVKDFGAGLKLASGLNSFSAMSDRMTHELAFWIMAFEMAASHIRGASRVGIRIDGVVSRESASGILRNTAASMIYRLNMSLSKTERAQLDRQFPPGFIKAAA
jgi:hypothetical protein